jgi:RND family efflux transporter MFP subunit
MLRHFGLALGGVLTAAALAGCDDADGIARAQEGAPPPPPVTVATPLVEDVADWMEFTGRFSASQDVEIRAQVGGYLMEVHFTDGARVEKGDLLYTIDPRPFQAALAVAQAEQTRAESQRNLAQDEFARAERLLARQVISTEEFEARKAAIAQAEADVLAAAANVQTAELNVEYTEIRSPIAGRVSDNRMDIGNLVSGGSASADVLTTVMATDPIYFTFEVSEAVFLHFQREGHLNSGAPVLIRLQDETDYNWVAKVDFTDNSLDSASGTIRLRAAVDNPDDFLKPGMFGDARVLGSQPYQAMLVPDTAIVTDAALRLVYVVGEDGMVQPRPVTLGPLSGTLRVVQSGIGPDDQVIINGLLRARPGAPVTPQVAEITRAAPAGEGGEGAAPPAPPSSTPLASIAAPANTLPVQP